MRHAVRALLENDEGKFLLVIHPKAKNWSLPGGHIEGNETIYEALHREIKEEFNLDIEIQGRTLGIERSEIKEYPCPECVYEIKYTSEQHGDVHKFEYIYKVKILGGEIKIQENEIEKYNFFTKEEILNLENTYNQIKKVIENS